MIALIQRFTVLVPVVLLALLFSACRGDEFKRLEEENKRLKQEIEALQEENEKRVAELQTAIENMKLTSRDVRVGSEGEMIVEDVLFSAGEAELGDYGKAVLKKVADILKDRPEHIRVDGHTDADPLIKTRRIWHSNWGLSAIRAANVVEFLEQCGIEPKRMSIAAFAGTRPIAPNTTKEQKTKNRRVAIRLFKTR